MAFAIKMILDKPYGLLNHIEFKFGHLYTVSALVQCANSIFQNDFLGRTQFKFSTNLRTLFEKIAQKLDF